MEFSKVIVPFILLSATLVLTARTAFIQKEVNITYSVDNSFSPVSANKTKCDYQSLLGMTVFRSFLSTPRNTHPSMCTRPNCRAVVLLFLVLSGQVELNPGPRAIKYPCNICAKSVRNNQPAVQCDDCFVWTHVRCIGFGDSTYQHLQHNSYYWFCASCGIPNYSASLGDLTSFESENSFNVLENTSSPGKPKLSSTPLKHKHIKSKSISCLSLNCNSLKSLGKIASFNAILQEQNPDVVFACETKLSPNIASYSIFPKNFTIFRNDRNENGGGVLLAFKNVLTVTVPAFLETKEPEITWSLLKSDQGKSLYLCSFYIPETRVAMEYLGKLRASLCSIFSKHHSKTPLVYISGDFNLGDIDWEDKSTTNPATSSYHQALLDLMDEFCLQKYTN